MKKSLMVLEIIFLLGSIVSFSENITSTKELMNHEQAIKDIKVTKTSGKGNIAKASINITVIVKEATERSYIYSGENNMDGELSMKVLDAKDAEVYFEYDGIDKKKVKRIEKRILEKRGSLNKEVASSKEQVRENLYVNLSNLGSNQKKKSRLIMVTEYR